MDIWDTIDNIISNSNNLLESEKKLKVQSTLEKTKKENSKSKETKSLDFRIIINITRNGTYIDSIPSEITKKIKNYFTLRNKNIMGYFDITNVWYNKGNSLYISRFGAFLLRNKFDNITYNNTIKLQNPLPNLIYKGQFNGNQEIIFNYIISKIYNQKKLDNGNSGLILNLQAGMGKTFLAMALIGHLKCRTLIVVHNSNMLDQWNKILLEYIPNAKIGLYYGKKKSFGDIVIGVINSLVMDDIKLKDFKSFREFYDSFDFVIFDESHIYCSKTRSKIFDICQAPYMIGLSATPTEREDSLDKIIHWNLGAVLVADKIEGYTMKNINFKGIVSKIKYTGHPDFIHHLINEKLEMTSVSKMLEQLSQDTYRQKMIIALILEQYKKGLNILVFADRRIYLEEIRIELEKLSLNSSILTNDDDLKDLEKLNGLETIRLVGGSTSLDMDNAKEKKNVILSTYAYMSTGCSIPKLNSLILATPRKSNMKQIINRIFRLGSDYSITREIIDIVDVKISLKNQYQSRKKYYNDMNYEITERKISWKDFE